MDSYSYMPERLYVGAAMFNTCLYQKKGWEITESRKHLNVKTTSQSNLSICRYLLQICKFSQKTVMLQNHKGCWLTGDFPVLFLLPGHLFRYGHRLGSSVTTPENRESCAIFTQKTGPTWYSFKPTWVYLKSVDPPKPQEMVCLIGK